MWDLWFLSSCYFVLDLVVANRELPNATLTRSIAHHRTNRHHLLVESHQSHIALQPPWYGVLLQWARA